MATKPTPQPGANEPVSSEDSRLMDPPSRDLLATDPSSLGATLVSSQQAQEELEAHRLEQEQAAATAAAQAEADAKARAEAEEKAKTESAAKAARVAKRLARKAGPRLVTGEIAPNSGKPPTKRRPAMRYLIPNVQIGDLPNGRDLNRDEVYSRMPLKEQRDAAEAITIDGKPVVQFYWDRETLENPADEEAEEKEDATPKQMGPEQKPCHGDC